MTDDNPDLRPEDMDELTALADKVFVKVRNGNLSPASLRALRAELTDDAEKRGGQESP